MTNFPEIPEETYPSKFSLISNDESSIPVSESEFKTILKSIEKGEKVSFNHVELVYVDEQEIVNINKKYLDKSYVTDIISFRYDEDSSNNSIEGTLYCCSPRISEQSLEFNSSEKNEFERVFIHGLLHLIGYEDHSETEKKAMTEREDFYLQTHHKT